MNNIFNILRRASFETLFAICIVCAAVLLASAVFAASPVDIEFPVSELGGCADQTSCKAYCDLDEHLEACYSFAEKYGLGANREEVEESLQELEEDGGPGGCARDVQNPGLACKRYCDSAAHIEECVSYAKEHQLLEGEELAEAEKVAGALKRGVKLPSQCGNVQSCRATCDDPADLETARACFNFAAEAGLLPPEVNREEAEKFFKAFSEGKTPFKSFAEMRRCDNPASDEVMEKCINFALEAGFLPPEEVEMLKKTGGKGPGGCRGREQCELYCEENAEACFAFAEEHGLLQEEDLEQMREGVEEMQAAMEDAPPEVEACIRSAIPEFDSILAGKKLPSPALGDKMKSCFENFYKNSSEDTGEEGFHRSEDFEAYFEHEDGGSDFSGEGDFDRSGDTKPSAAESSYGEQFKEQYEKQYGEEFRSEVNRQVEDEVKRQYDAEYERQYEEEYQRVRGQFPEGSFDGSSMPPLESDHSSSSFVPENGDLLGNVWSAVRGLLNLNR